MNYIPFLFPCFTPLESTGDEARLRHSAGKDAASSNLSDLAQYERIYKKSDEAFQYQVSIVYYKISTDNTSCRQAMLVVPEISNVSKTS